MWEYFWPDVAFDVVKGLIAGSQGNRISKEGQ